MSTESEKYFSPLNGWRAFAILGVLGCHGIGTYFTDSTRSSTLLYTCLAHGYIGVNLFFAISGFLICFRILEREAREGRIDFKGFYIRRSFRIIPPLFVYLAVLAILSFSNILDISSFSLVSSALFISNYSLKTHQINWFIGHLWSLAVEEHYYLVFPFMLFLFKGSNARRAIALSIWAFIIAIWRSIEFQHQFLSKLLPGIGFFTRTDICLDFLIFGAAVSVIWYTPSPFKKIRDVINSNTTFLIALSAYLLVLFLDPHFTLLWQALLVPFILASTLNGGIPILSALLDSLPLQWIGKISYSLYIWNNFFLVPVGSPIIPFFHWIQTPPFNFVALIVTACLSYYGIERPMIRVGRKLLSTKTIF